MKKILVIGDSCKDVFVYCAARRLAPDIPVPVLQIASTTHNPGMAKNVHRNVRAIYKNCVLITNNNWQSVTKTRYMHNSSNQAFMRVDADTPIDRINIHKINLKKYDIVAVSDYDKGFLTREDIRHICSNHPLVFVDTKKPVSGFLKGAAYIKINQFELERSLPIPQYLLKRLICTKGGDSVEFNGKKFPIPNVVEVKDTSGAGDSFFSALVVRFAETGDIEESIRFANLCAGDVVQQRGVTVIKRPTLV